MISFKKVDNLINETSLLSSFFSYSLYVRLETLPLLSSIFNASRNTEAQAASLLMLHKKLGILAYYGLNFGTFCKNFMTFEKYDLCKKIKKNVTGSNPALDF